MTFRYRIADWISGGMLTRFNQAKVQAYKHEMDAVEARLRAEHHRNRVALQAADMRAALLDIAGMATPKANATVRRMAERASEALKDDAA